MSKKVGVIGAGFSSLYAAAYLSKNGFDVHVFEKNSMAGGRSQFYEVEGFKFDMGPSWYWMPDVIDAQFNEIGEKRENYYSISRLDPAYQVFWKDNEPTKIPADYSELKKLFDSFEEKGGQKLDKFLKDAKIKYEVAVADFLDKPGIKWSELIDLKVLLNGLKLDVFKSVAKDVSNRFSSERARGILNFPVIFLGEMPNQIPSLYTMMNYADLSLGTWYPEGGMHDLANALYQICLKNDVKFNFNASVEKILVRNDQASGLLANGKEHFFDAIIGGADYHHIEQTMLPNKYKRYDEKYWNSRKMAPSSLIYYVGLNKKIKLEHHNLFFDESLEIHGEAIYSNPRWPENPLFYLCVPSKTDKNVAPKEGENLFFLMPLAPNLEDEETVRQHYFDKMLDKVKLHTGVDIRDSIVYQQSFCVSDFKNAYNSYKGNAYGLANTLRQTANLKPKLKSKLNKLYFCGQLTVPGPGVPPALISGKLAAKQLIREL